MLKFMQMTCILRIGQRRRKKTTMIMRTKLISRIDLQRLFFLIIPVNRFKRIGYYWINEKAIAKHHKLYYLFQVHVRSNLSLGMYII